jgi:hypothetical protein
VNDSSAFAECNALHGVVDERSPGIVEVVEEKVVAHRRSNASHFVAAFSH